MFRMVAFGLLLAVLAADAARAQSATPGQPLRYEVQINGEEFVVEANRAVKLQSKLRPGVTYNVAIRLAPVQQIRLNNLEFSYELPAKVEVEGDAVQRTARLTHELGFSLILTDLGPPLAADDQQQTLKVLVDSVTGVLREEKRTAIESGDPYQRTFKGSSARGVTIRCRDAKNLGRVCLIYVLTGPAFSGTCVVEYLDHDSDDALPLIKRLLDSVQSVPKK
jgi:hypothetical protein